MRGIIQVAFYIKILLKPLILQGILKDFAKDFAMQSEGGGEIFFCELNSPALRRNLSASVLLTKAKLTGTLHLRRLSSTPPACWCCFVAVDTPMRPWSAARRKKFP